MSETVRPAWGNLLTIASSVYTAHLSRVLLLSFLLALTLLAQASGKLLAGAVVTFSAASYGDTLTPDSVAAAFGTGLATGTFKAADTNPNLPGVQLPTVLGGTFVEVAGRRTGLFFVSPTQINFLLPPETAAGNAALRIVSGNGEVSTGSIKVSATAPALFTANASGAGVPAAELLRVAANGAQTLERNAVAQLDAVSRNQIPRPLDLGTEGTKVFLILYGAGLRRAADPNNDGNLQESVRVLLAGTEVIPSFAGAHPLLLGVDQINVELPRSLLGRGKVGLVLAGVGLPVSNAVEIEIAGVRGVTPPVVGDFGTTSVLAGQAVTLRGNNFSTSPAENVVRIGGVEATVTAATATQLTAIVPFGAASGPVTIRTARGETTSAERLQVRTSISGTVETPTSQPLGGLTVQASASGRTITAQTTASGAFVLPDVPPGPVRVRVLGANANFTPAFSDFSTLFGVSGDRDNQLERRIVLQQATGSSGQVGGGQSQFAASETTTTTLSIPAFAPIETPENDAEGGRALAPSIAIRTGNIVFEIPNNVTARFPNGASSGFITLTQLENSRTPAPLPAGVFSSAIVQLTPYGVTLTPGGKLIFPNSDGYAAGQQLKLFKLDQNDNSRSLGRFVEAGLATVSANGQTVETGENALTETSVYFVAQPRPTTTVIGRVLDSDRTPVRMALVRVRGQEGFTDGNGGFTLPNVSLGAGNETLTVEASLLRPNGRVDHTQRSGVTPVRDGVTNVTPELILPAAAADQPPVIIAASRLTVHAGQTTDFNIGASDPDSGQPVTLAVTGAAFAAIVRNNNAFVLRLTPANSNAGEHTLRLTATDNRGLTTSQNIVVTVVIPNRAPTANGQTVTTAEDVAATITLTGNDPDGSPLTYNIVAQPQRGTLTGAGATRTYTPAAHFNGIDSFTFRVNDGQADSTTATVTINVTPVNDKPVLNVPGQQIVDELSPVIFSVTASDVDTDQTLTFTATGLPPGASFNPATRQFNWRPQSGQAGRYTITFTVTDNGTPQLSDSKTVLIIVVSLNARPVVIVPGPQSVNVGQNLIFNVSATDVDNQLLILTAAGLPAGASFANGQFSWTPTAQQTGQHTVGFTATDTGTPPLSDTKTVTITVMTSLVLLDHRVTPGPIPDACVPPELKTTYAPTDAVVRHWTRVNGLRAGDVVRWDWIQPNGAVHTTASLTSTVNGDGCFWSATISIAGAPAALLPGAWQVRVFYNDSLLLTDDFTICSAPVVSTHPANQTVNAGSQVSFTAAATGAPAPSVQWQVSSDGGETFSNISGATAATLSFAAASGDNGKRYRAVFTNACGTATSNAATLTVTSPGPAASGRALIKK